MELKWEILDLEQTLLAEVTEPKPGGVVEVGLNAARRATLPIDLGDEVSVHATPFDSVLRATLLGPDDFERVVFQGKINLPESSGDTELNLVRRVQAACPLQDAEQAHIMNPTEWPPDSGTDASQWTTFTDVEQSVILWYLINLTDLGTVDLGTLEGSIDRDRTYLPGKNLKDALVEMSEVENGPDFEFEPVAGDDEKLVVFNTFSPKQGDDLSSTVNFIFGQDPEDEDPPPETATEFKYSPGGRIVNRAYAVGFPYQFPTIIYQPVYVAEHAASIAQYGVFEEMIDLNDLTAEDLNALEGHAKAAVAARAYPVKYFSFSPGLEPVGDDERPAFGRDYWIGDTIGFTAYLPNETLELEGRISDGRFIQTDTGQLKVELDCTVEPSFTGVTSSYMHFIQEPAEDEL